MTRVKFLINGIFNMRRLCEGISFWILEIRAHGMVVLFYAMRVASDEGGVGRCDEGFL
jgi:hypothetical protein